MDLEFTLREGEEIRTEVSTKYDRPMVEAMLEAAGLELQEFYTDPENLFALSLARRR
jgi:L-histidine N-alpha-methyltransferase